MTSKTHLLEHEGKLHPFPWHALHIQEAVEFEIEFPLALVLSFLTARQSGGKITTVSLTQVTKYKYFAIGPQ